MYTVEASSLLYVALVDRQCYKTFREDIGEIKSACLTGIAKIGQLFILTFFIKVNQDFQKMYPTLTR